MSFLKGGTDGSSNHGCVEENGQVVHSHLNWQVSHIHPNKLQQKVLQPVFAMHRGSGKKKAAFVVLLLLLLLLVGVAVMIMIMSFYMKSYGMLCFILRIAVCQDVFGADCSTAPNTSWKLHSY